MQKVSQTKLADKESYEQKLPRKKFHKRNQFHEEKNQCKSFTLRNINMQEVSRAKNTARNKYQEKNNTQEVP